jgi:hypothetical protein
MKSENRIFKNESGSRVSPIFVRQPKRKILKARSRRPAEYESKRDRQKKAVLKVLRAWSTGELTRSATEFE